MNFAAHPTPPNASRNCAANNAASTSHPSPPPPGSPQTAHSHTRSRSASPARSRTPPDCQGTRTPAGPPPNTARSHQPPNRTPSTPFDVAARRHVSPSPTARAPARTRGTPAASDAAESPRRQARQAPRAAAPTRTYLEHRVIPPRLQRPLPAPRATRLDPRLARREERLQLIDRQRPPPRVALELVQMRHQIPLIEQLPRAAAKLPLADRRPRIPPIAHILREHLQPELIRPQRRARQPLRPRLANPRSTHPHPTPATPTANTPRALENAAAPTSFVRIVFAFKYLAACWLRHPASIASNTADSIRNDRTPAPNTRASAASTSAAV